MKDDHIKTLHSDDNSQISSSENSQSTSRTLSTIASNFKKSSFNKKVDSPELNDLEISFKNLPVIKKYLSGNNITSANKYSISRKQYRKIALQIKNARILALLPFVQNDASSYENYSS